MPEKSQAFFHKAVQKYPPWELVKPLSRWYGRTGVQIISIKKVIGT